MSEARNRGSESTREVIVETALRLFRERGFDATTMRAIAAEAGCPSATPTTTSTAKRR
ncbi:helix-turn-helix domain-containing protein [Nonomuraea antimicrobica]